MSTAQDQHTVADRLISWYGQSHRDLPWRNTTDPYAIWLSEIMLQQTQVATVLPYYARFLAAFPTIQALAAAPADAVLKQWEGLGYYARGRNLQKAAQQIIEQHGGAFPQTFEAVHALPGIGESTAGAILTFAFGQPHAILDGNVKRVLSRLTGETGNIQEKNTLARLWETSRNLLPQDAQAAYTFNQALMELGATLCTPKNPQCTDCPWQDDCVALKKGLQDKLPVKTKAKATPHYTIGAGVVFDETGQVLIALRPAEGLLGGLWEFPGGKCKNNESIPQCIVRELKEETGLTVEVESLIATVKHAYTHFKITLHAYRCRKVSGTAKPKASQAVRWVNIAELGQYAFPKANHAILKALQEAQAEQCVLC